MKKKIYHLVEIYSFVEDLHEKRFIIKSKGDDKIGDLMCQSSINWGGSHGFDFYNSFSEKPKGVKNISFKEFKDLF